MKTTAFDIAVATEVENAVMEVYNCKRNDIHQFIDSDVKKVVVFVLCYHIGYNRRLVGWNYKITHWYIPTACEEVKVIYEHDLDYKNKIDLVLSKVQSLKSTIEWELKNGVILRLTS
jgi:hypothetical protein